ncbi:hypothetical protein H310_14241 [Aphanomyces invadans]|uniref:Winged helix-turn helix domain-containing protein n=1 Tax=Aphanomyces invadans TaxID=157072 RepID=A0A024TAK8_9STRA|nr:hypothetical protein H310_14241 [Aphanomyces invadans]ETV91078.1 hypothetical protein H310_14241 [Aphanomyces invadans]|eukprot:XP_008880274.1 hypothetical protein H310_14241 [Aphanomyces invadans]
MDDIVTKQHAHPNTVFHCLYGFFNLGYTRHQLAAVYNKSERTIGNWIRVYQEMGTYERSNGTVDRKFTVAQRLWLRDFYERRPLAYLDEAQAEFKRVHHMDISKSTVWRIIPDFGLTWKVLERRAMHIKEKNVFRFVKEMDSIDWSRQTSSFWTKHRLTIVE